MLPSHAHVWLAVAVDIVHILNLATEDSTLQLIKETKLGVGFGG